MLQMESVHNTTSGEDIYYRSKLYSPTIKERINFFVEEEIEDNSLSLTTTLLKKKEKDKRVYGRRSGEPNKNFLN